MAKDDFFAGRNKIDVVAQLPAGHIGARIEDEHAPRQPAPVRVVRNDETEERAEGNQEREHGGLG